MGKRNQAKRAARKRERQRRGPTPPRRTGDFGRSSDEGPHGPGCGCAADVSAPPPDGPDEAADLLFNAAHAARVGVATAAAGATQLAGRFARRPGVLHAAAVLSLGTAIGEAWELGWQPIDVWEVIRRSADAAVTDLLVDMIAAEAAQHAAATVHPRWRDQLARLEATVWWRRDRPLLEQWAERHDVDLEQATAATITLLGKLAGLDRLPQIIPPPGTVQRAMPSTAHVDPKVLARVRGLLAKAESTEFPEEAEALSAKAQELMNRHAFERALLDADPRQHHSVASIRIWLDSPYLDAKSHLVSAIARANRCKSVFYSSPGFVALVGEELDLEITELLATSLLVQATRAMITEDSQRYGSAARTRSFRRAFLIAYAVRIGERLTSAGARAHDSAADSKLLPVLAGRSRAVEQAFEAMFPDTYRRKSLSISNRAGWQAGRTAADRARLDLERRVLSA